MKICVGAKRGEETRTRLAEGQGTLERIIGGGEANRTIQEYAPPWFRDDTLRRPRKEEGNIGAELVKMRFFGQPCAASKG